MDELLNLTGPKLAMIVAGLGLFFMAGFVLWGSRWGNRLESGEKPRFSFPGVGEVSEPTRLLAGFYGLLVAYHLMVWALPPGLTYMQLPRAYWWAVILVGAAVVGGSLLMDRKEKRSAGPGGSPPASDSSDQP
jgi:hypothetical protein